MRLDPYPADLHIYKFDKVHHRETIIKYMKVVLFYYDNVASHTHYVRRIQSYQLSNRCVAKSIDMPYIL